MSIIQSPSMRDAISDRVASLVFSEIFRLDIKEAWGVVVEEISAIGQIFVQKASFVG